MESGRVSLSYHTAMLIGDRRTKHGIRAFQSPGHRVVIPKGEILENVRTSVEPGYRFPIAMRFVARKNPSMHIFEYRGGTFYIPFALGLIEATTEIKPA
jgi:hypothetical protein